MANEEYVKPDPRTIVRCNGKEVEVHDLVGPIVSGNGFEWWLVRMFHNDRLVTSNPSGAGEFVICRAPVTEAWGWDFDSNSLMVHYAFADGVKRMMEVNP